MRFFGNFVSTALGVTVGGLILVKIVTSKEAVDEVTRIVNTRLQDEIKKGIKIVFNNDEK